MIESDDLAALLATASPGDLPQMIKDAAADLPEQHFGPMDRAAIAVFAEAFAIVIEGHLEHCRRAGTFLPTEGDKARYWRWRGEVVR